MKGVLASVLAASSDFSAELQDSQHRVNDGLQLLIPIDVSDSVCVPATKLLRLRSLVRVSLLNFRNLCAFLH